MVTVRVHSKLKTSWKTVVFTNKVGKNSRCFVGTFSNKTVLTLVLEYWILNIEYWQRACVEELLNIIQVSQYQYQNLKKFIDWFPAWRNEPRSRAKPSLLPSIRTILSNSGLTRFETYRETVINGNWYEQRQMKQIFINWAKKELQ